MCMTAFKNKASHEAHREPLLNIIIGGNDIHEKISITMFLTIIFISITQYLIMKYKTLIFNGLIL